MKNYIRLNRNEMACVRRGYLKGNDHHGKTTWAYAVGAEIARDGDDMRAGLRKRGYHTVARG